MFFPKMHIMIELNGNESPKLFGNESLKLFTISMNKKRTSDIDTDSMTMGIQEHIQKWGLRKGGIIFQYRQTNLKLHISFGH